jgi:mannose-6-phosphate isomerase-like protein (cupin superfamily)
MDENSVRQFLTELYGTSIMPINVPKPWGSETVYAATGTYVGKILSVRAGCELSLQYHLKKRESNLLQSGTLVLVRGPNALRESIDDLTGRVTEIELTPGSVWTNEPGDIHTIRAITDATVLEVSTPELDDVVRITDRYGRAGTDRP